jgi:hypothetical protein
MAISTLERARVTITIPADCIDDVRVGVLADLKSDADGFGVDHAHLLTATDELRRSMCRSDRDSRIGSIRDTCELLDQLPDEDAETTVSGTTEAFRFALEATGRILAEQVTGQFEYCPVPVEGVLPLLERLRWTAEQVAMIGER